MATSSSDIESMDEPSQPTVEREFVAPKKRSTSDAWQYFGFLSTDIEQTDVKCRLCKKSVAAKGGNTSNLVKHLKLHHPIEYSGFTQNQQKSRSPSPSTSVPVLKQTSIMQTVPYERTSNKWKSLTDSVAKYLAKEMVPIYTVEKSGFIEMLKKFDPRYTLPSRKYFSNTIIPDMYNTLVDKVKEEIKTATFYAGTTDMWSSTTMEPYMSYTLHYISDDWKLETRHLQTVFFPQDHTGDNISEALKDTLESWGLEERRQTSITTDNGSNIVKAVNDNDWIRVPCFGHRLNLAVTNSLKDNRITRAVAVCKKIVSSFSYSYKKRRELKRIQGIEKLPEHSLIVACDTRWGSMQSMIARFLEQENAIRGVLSKDRKSTGLLPKHQDIDVLESTNKALAPVREFTDMLGGDEYVSVSSVVPLLKLLNSEILASKDDDVELTKSIKMKMLSYLNEKYDENITKFLNKCTFLDPRFKTTYLDEREVNEIKESIKNEITDIKHEFPELACISDSKKDQTNLTAGPSHVKKRRLGSLFKRHESSRPGDETDNVSLTLEEIVDKEILKYLTIPKLDHEDDPLLWWKVQSPSFPNMSLLAKKYLCVPATSCASERLFSTSGNIVSSKRANLKPHKVNMLVFLAKNLK